MATTRFGRPTYRDPSVRLRDLVVPEEHGVWASGPPDPSLSGILVDPDHVRPGCLYVAAYLKRSFDGHDHIEEAIERGAHVIVARTKRPSDLDPRITWWQTDDPNTLLGKCLAASYQHPGEDLEILAVTGTNGKTTVTYLLASILEEAGHVPAIIGTLGVRWKETTRLIPPPFTTPIAPILQPLLDELRAAEVSHVAIEATSHSLATGRLAGTRVRVGGFTNLSHDHLDFHGSMEGYGDAKGRLFSDLAERACFNRDDAFGRELAARYRGEKLTVSLASAAGDLGLEQIDTQLHHSTARLCTPWGSRSLMLPIFGTHNLENALVALGMALLAGISLDHGVAALARAVAPRGRCQWIEGQRRVMVDYAHTPDALSRVLGNLRAVVEGRLICVFGAGGDRDQDKRAVMGTVAAREADLSIVTTDNPRDEAPEAIVAGIVAGIPKGRAYRIEPDRKAAIALAIEQAGPDDVVLIAGKGHETHIVRAGQRLPHDDLEVAQALVASTS